MSVKHYTLTETAKLIRQALKAAFPKTKFSVRSKSYSGGCSITTHWTDGPTDKQVDAIQDNFAGASFDGMIDLKSYNDPSEWNGQRVEFAPDYVFTSRETSRAAFLEAVRWVADRSNTTAPAVHPQWNCIGHGDDKQILFSFFVKEAGTPELAQDSRHPQGGEWFSRLVNAYIGHRSYENPVVEPSVPSYVSQEFIDAKVAELLAGAR